MKKAHAVKKPKSWARDEEHPELLVPLPAFDAEENPESTYTDKKFQKRKDDFVEEQKTKKKIALSKKEQARDEDEFDDDRGLEGDAEHSDDAAHPVIARNFANDAIRFDYATGKTQLTRELVPQWFADYNLFRPDDTVVLNGKRRTGKSFFMRSILYEMRHMFAGGLVFTATKHNGVFSGRDAVLLTLRTGFWQQCVPDRFIHETLDARVIENFLAIRANAVRERILKFGPAHRDELYYFIILDDMVDQKTRYYEVRSGSSVALRFSPTTTTGPPHGASLSRSASCASISALRFWAAATPSADSSHASQRAR